MSVLIKFWQAHAPADERTIVPARADSHSSRPARPFRANGEPFFDSRDRPGRTAPSRSWHSRLLHRRSK